MKKGDPLQDILDDPLDGCLVTVMVLTKHRREICHVTSLSLVLHKNNSIDSFENLNQWRNVVGFKIV